MHGIGMHPLYEWAASTVGLADDLLWPVFTLLLSLLITTIWMLLPRRKGSSDSEFNHFLICGGLFGYGVGALLGDWVQAFSLGMLGLLWAISVAGLLLKMCGGGEQPSWSGDLESSSSKLDHL